ncbi:amidohydrolase [Mycolicibacterium sp. P9-64]|uniref:amidohydrolase n=1 Tax=Mycolicibacterium sp. P9-64 TaxID=2024612 RepID=UPI0011EDFED1|nr:amidohydrolase [Mycolicibacterium sp. P9-64]KAA0085227.1 amidohydrolase [Mycolicibacterium sp. P9-64]
MVSSAPRVRKIADRIFTNAAVFQAAGADPADTVAVHDGLIVGVGRGVDRDMIGRHTEITDLGGASLLPGFIDAHAHPVAAGMSALRCDLSGLPHDRSAYLAAIADYAARHQDESVIAGAGWYGDAFGDGFPTRHDIDAIVSDRPVIMTSHDYHGAWVNSRALELAGISSTTTDPAGGRIVREHGGEPSGMLLDRGGDAVNELIPAVTPEFMRRALLEAQRKLHSVGVTGWQDAAVGAEFFGLKDNFTTYVDADEAGELTARVVGALWWEADRGLEQIDHLRARRELTSAFPVASLAPGHSRFTASMVKVMQDGICENCTAAMLAPYRAVAGHDTASGQSFIAPDELRDVTALLADERFGIHMHAVGDRAVRECLDALAHAVAQHPGFDGRHQIAHLDVVDPDDIPRFGQLGVIANIQALWARRDREIVERKLPLLGPERERWHFPFGSIQRHGGTLAMGSDWPVTDPNPLWAIHTAVHRTGTRADPHAIGDGVFDTPLQAAEAITLQSAIHAYTAGSAHANGQDRTGRIAVGMLADLVVLDQDVFAAEDIGTVVPVQTIVGGTTVYQAS